MIYKTFEEWADGQWLEDGEPRKQAYTRDELLLIEMGWNYGVDAAKLSEPETPYKVGQRLQRTGFGISDIPTSVPHDDDIAEALRGYEDARLSEPEPEPVAYDFQKALFRAYHLGQRYWADADSESYSANKRADKHRQDFDALCEEAISYTAPPQRKEK